VYVVMLVAGLTGLAVMMVAGFAHRPHVHHRLHHARAHGHALAPERVTLARRTVRWLGPLLSPLTWFSWMLGAGAVGTIATVLRASPLVTHLAAIAGALGFQLLVVRPMWKLVFQFESQPATNLEGCLLQEVEAVTAFNARGEGLVRVTIDGRSEDLLATLKKSDDDTRPRRGDRLVIEDVDPSRNTCIVSRA
jgi:hypothetical protein